MVKKLLSYDECDVNCTDVEGRTIVSRAIGQLSLNNISQFEFILKDKKADPNMTDLKGQSPLHYLCDLSQKKYIKKKQEEEKKYNLTKKFEQEFEQIVEKAIRLLVDSGADINKLNSHQQSPFTIAIQQKNFFIIKNLLKKGDINYSFINKADQNIFHILGNLISDGITGIEQFKSIFEEIKKDKNVDIKEYINKVDYHGFTPLLFIVKIFSENASNYKKKRFEEIQKEMFEKKGGQIKVKKSNKKRMNKYPILSGFKPDGTLVKLSESEIEKAIKQSEEDLQNYEKQFQNLIDFLVNKGADVGAVVQKIKKYRKEMDVEEYIDQSEDDQQSDNERQHQSDSDNQSQQESDQDSDKSDRENESEQYDDDDDEDEDDQSQDKIEQKLRNGDYKRDKLGNPRIKSKQKYKPQYNSYGKMNIFGLALFHPSKNFLKNMIEKYPQLIDNTDYLNRNHISKFVIQHTDFSKEKDKQNVTCEILEWLCTLEINVNDKDIIKSTPLITAIASKKFKFAKCLALKSDLNVKDIFGKSPLIMAINSIKSNNLDFIEFLLSNGADPNMTDNYGRTSLHHAVNIAEKGANASFDLENLLMNNGADVNIKDSLGRTPLHYCFIGMNEIMYSDEQYDPFETVSSLCAHPQIEIDVKDIQGKTPLHYAAQKNSTTSAIFMMEKNANVNDQDNYGNTPLSIAFRFQRSEITTTFIQNKADTSRIINILKNHNENGEEIEENNDRDNNYGRSIQYRRYNRNQRFNNWQYRQRNQNVNQKDLLETLLDQYKLKKDPYNSLMKQKLAKEEVSAKNKDRLIFQDFRENGVLPLGKHSFFKAAIMYEWQGIAYLLLIKGNYNLFNALEDAINIDLYQLSITLLSKYSKDKSITTSNLDGQNLLHILCKRPSSDINLQVKLFEKLLARNVDYKQQDKKKNYCLHFANSHPEITSKLLDLGLDCNAYNEDQNTPFSLAVQKNVYKALKIYAKNYKPDFQKKFKAKPIGQDEELMYTPFLFQFANKNKDLHLLDTLLNYGSDINEVDSLGRSALYYAIYHNSEKLVKFILQCENFDIKKVDNNGKSPVHYVVNPVEYGSYENIEILELLKNSNFDLQVKDNNGNTPMYYALLQDTSKLSETLKSYGIEASKDKKLPKRAATSIVATADFPEEEIDYEEDSKVFNDDPTYDKYKEFFEQKNAGKKVELDQYVTKNYRKNDNYVVLDDDKEPYNLMMTKVDLSFGGYSKYVFYIMQIIYEKNSGVYILYTRWGQIGQMGQMQHTPFTTKEEAVKEFSKIFLSKSGNKWTERHDFKKKEKKYQLQTVIQDNDKRAFNVKPYDYEILNSKETMLDKPIYEFIRTISNSEIFKSAQNKFTATNEFLPLTKLSKSVLIKALDTLDDIRDENVKIATLRQKLTKENNMQRLLEKEQAILNLSNRYYELIPRTPSRWEPLYPLNSDDAVNNEVSLVENLIDFETAIKIIMGSYTKLKILNPMDYCFNSLNVRIKQIEFDHPESKMIHQYISRTNKQILDPENKIIKNIFAVERRGEAERISQFKEHTKKLLWHGTGVQNLLGIFSLGLRINSIGSQKSGSSLGEGIYFSDLYAKSSHYARNQDVGVKSRFILLCEVAVGKEYQIKTQEQYDKFSEQNHVLQKGFNSIKLVGNECPDEKKNLFLSNGTIVPIGNIIDFNKELKQNIKLQKAGKPVQNINKRYVPKKQTIRNAMKSCRLKNIKSSAKAPRKQLATKAARSFPKKRMPKQENSSDDDDIEEMESDIEETRDLSEDDEDADNKSNKSDYEEGSDQEDDYQDDEEKYENDNLLYDVPEQNKKIPFSQQLTHYQHSEYVVQNTSQVRIRYLIEINN